MELSLSMFSLELRIILRKSPQDITQFDLQLETITVKSHIWETMF